MKIPADDPVWRRVQEVLDLGLDPLDDDEVAARCADDPDFARPLFDLLSRLSQLPTLATETACSSEREAAPEPPATATSIDPIDGPPRVRRLRSRGRVLRIAAAAALLIASTALLLDLDESPSAGRRSADDVAADGETAEAAPAASSTDRSAPSERPPLRSTVLAFEVRTRSVSSGRVTRTRTGWIRGQPSGQHREWTEAVGAVSGSPRSSSIRLLRSRSFRPDFSFSE